MRKKNPDEELMMDFVVLPEDLAQEGEEGMEGDTEIPFIPSWCGHPEKVRQKNLKQKKISNLFFFAARSTRRHVEESLSTSAPGRKK